MLDIARPQTPILLKRPISLREAEVVAQGYYLDANTSFKDFRKIIHLNAYQLVDR